MSIKTPEAIALATSEEFGYPINPSPGTITDMLVAAIEADRAQRPVVADSGYTPVEHEAKARFVTGSIDLIRRRDGVTDGQAGVIAEREFYRWLESRGE